VVSARSANTNAVTLSGHPSLSLFPSISARWSPTTLHFPSISARWSPTTLHFPLRQPQPLSLLRSTVPTFPKSFFVQFMLVFPFSKSLAFANPTTRLNQIIRYNAAKTEYPDSYLYHHPKNPARPAYLAIKPSPASPPAKERPYQFTPARGRRT
jgi:hypothetical protein